jgi:hypothetical protein
MKALNHEPLGSGFAAEVGEGVGEERVGDLVVEDGIAIALEEDEAALAPDKFLIALHEGEDRVVGDAVVEGEGKLELGEEFEKAS